MSLSSSCFLTVFVSDVQEPLCTRNATEIRNKAFVFPVSTDRPTRSTPTA